MLSPRISVILDTASASPGTPAALSMASSRSAAITGSYSYILTVQPAAAKSSASSPRPAAASITVSSALPFLIPAARSISSLFRFSGRIRASIWVKSARSSITPSLKNTPSSSRRRTGFSPVTLSAPLRSRFRRRSRFCYRSRFRRRLCFRCRSRLRRRLRNTRCTAW